MIELYLKLNCNFTETEKEECKPVIHRLIELANLARMEGILALEKEMEEERGIFLKTAIGLVVDGTDPELVKQILQAAILSGRYSGFQLLSRLLMAEGVLSLQMGENPHIITLKLGAMMGEKYISQISDEYFNMENIYSSYNQFLKFVREWQAFPESIPFETRLLHLDNMSLQRVLQDIEYSTLLTALRGCSFKLIQKISENISLRMRAMLIEEWKAIEAVDKKYVLYCQNHIMEKIAILESRGEIIDSSNFAFDE